MNEYEEINEICQRDIMRDWEKGVSVEGVRLGSVPVGSLPTRSVRVRSVQVGSVRGGKRAGRTAGECTRPDMVRACV